MNTHGKLLRINSDRSIFIVENEDGSYISEEGEIKYKNIGKNFDMRLVNSAFVNIDSKGMVNVLDAVGNSVFFFPGIWLDTNQMKILGLVESGLLALK